MLSSLTFSTNITNSNHSTVSKSSSTLVNPEIAHNYFPTWVPYVIVLIVMFSAFYILKYCGIITGRPIDDVLHWYPVALYFLLHLFLKIRRLAIEVCEKIQQSWRHWSARATVWWFFAPHLRRGKRDVEVGGSLDRSAAGTSSNGQLESNDGAKSEGLLGSSREPSSNASAKHSPGSGEDHLPGSNADDTPEQQNERSLFLVPSFGSTIGQGRAHLRIPTSVSAHELQPYRPRPVLFRVSSAPARLMSKEVDPRESSSILWSTSGSHREDLAAALRDFHMRQAT